jgi:hypothetical protein
LLKNNSRDEKEVDSIGAILYDNNPNPFTDDTEIKMRLAESVRQAILIVYNMQGNQLKSLQVSGRGETAVKVSGNELSAGMYLYTLIVDGKALATKRMILTK